MPKISYLVTYDFTEKTSTGEDIYGTRNVPVDSDSELSIESKTDMDTLSSALFNSHQAEEPGNYILNLMVTALENNI